MCRRRTLRDWTGCLTDLSHLLSSFCVCPMSDLLWVALASFEKHDAVFLSLHMAMELL